MTDGTVISLSPINRWQGPIHGMGEWIGKFPSEYFPFPFSGWIFHFPSLDKPLVWSSGSTQRVYRNKGMFISQSAWLMWKENSFLPVGNGISSNPKQGPVIDQSITGEGKWIVHFSFWASLWIGPIQRKGRNVPFSIPSVFDHRLYDQRGIGLLP